MEELETLWDSELPVSGAVCVFGVPHPPNPVLNNPVITNKDICVRFLIKRSPFFS